MDLVAEAKCPHGPTCRCQEFEALSRDAARALGLRGLVAHGYLGSSVVDGPWTAYDTRCALMPPEVGHRLVTVGWASIGPALDRHSIELLCVGEKSCAAYDRSRFGGDPIATGPTPLVAALRALIAKADQDQLITPWLRSERPVDVFREDGAVMDLCAAIAEGQPE